MCLNTIPAPKPQGTSRQRGTKAVRVENQEVCHEIVPYRSDREVTYTHDTSTVRLPKQT